MSEDESFLRAMLAAPADSALPLVYADWLEDRGDPRAEYLRLGVHLAALPFDHEDAQSVRRRMVELGSYLPAPWLAVFGDHHSSGSDQDPRRLKLAAAALQCPVR